MRVFTLALLLTAPCAAEDPVGRALEALRAVGPEGRGNAVAMRAWAEVSKAEASALPRILAALDGARPLPANWIRSAADAVAEGALHRGEALPAAELEAFVLETGHDPRARRLALEWLARVDAAAPDRLIPRLGDDPSVEIRRDAVARVVEGAERARSEGRRDGAASAFREALRLARDDDQVRAVAARLKELGETVDLPRHYGFVMAWKLIGPFDNTGSKAFDVAYPPEPTTAPTTEPKADTTAEYEGKGGKVRWKEVTTTDDYGLVDVNKALGNHKGAIAYARAEFESDRACPVDLRLGCINAWKLWLNGQLLFAHEEYHHGMEMDQYRVRGALREGRNVILLKVCQNEQTEDWAQLWQFQLRVCDAAGTAVLPSPPTSLPPGGPPAAGGETRRDP